MYATVPIAEPGLVRCSSGKVASTVTPDESDGLPAGCVHLREPEVQNFGVTAPGHENIRRLDVAMNDALGVSRVEGVGNLDPKREQSVHSIGAIADDVLQRGSVEVLHDDERLAVLLADVVDRADIRMIERRRSLGFAAKPFERLPILSDVFREKFQRDKAVEARVLRFVNNTHAAAAQLLDDAVMRDNLANHSPPPDWAEILRLEVGQVTRIGGRAK